MSIFKKKTADLKNDTSGSAGIVFAVALPVLVGFTGLAIDVGNAYLQEARLQQTTDQVSLAALVYLRDRGLEGSTKKAGDSYRTKLITDFAQVNMSEAENTHAVKEDDIVFGNWDFRTKTFTPATKDRHLVNAAQIKGQKSGARDNAVTTLFAQIFIDEFNVYADSLAVMPRPPQFHLLSEDATALNFKDSDADVWDIVLNSTSDKAAVFQGRTSFGGTTIHTPGKIVGGKYDVDKFRPETSGIKDFLEQQPQPKVTASCVGRPVYEPTPKNNRIVVKPGTYCGIKLVSPVAEVIFEPGQYVFNGPLIIHDQSKVVGDGVSFYMTGKLANLDIQRSRLHLRAPEKGDGMGITIMSDRRESSAPTHHVFQNSYLWSVGTMYSPATDFSFINSTLNGSCRNVCFVSEKLTIDRTYINYYHGLSWSAPEFGHAKAVDPLGLHPSMRPYIIDL